MQNFLRLLIKHQQLSLITHQLYILYMHNKSHNPADAIIFLHNNYYYNYSSGKSWRDLRSNHGKQLMPQNVYNYIPGFTRAADRFVNHMLRLANDEGYVEDIHSLVLNWSMEGRELIHTSVLKWPSQF